MLEVLCVRVAVTSSHIPITYMVAAVSVASFRSKFGLFCTFTECRIISYRYLGP